MKAMEQGRSTSGVIPGMVAAVALLALGAVFAGVQDVWIDESTQLSGAALPFGRMMVWLAGAREPSLGVPGDRMPPLSYLVDWAAFHAGLGVTGLRLLHLLFVGAGVGVVVAAAARRLGVAAGLAVAAVMVLSPRMIEASVELRAYPLWLAITCIQLVLLMRLVEMPRVDRVRLAWFWLASLLAIYTHFFGLVSSGAMLLGLLATRRGDRRDIGLVIASGAGLLVAGAGLVPFVTGSVAVSAAGTEGGSFGLRGIVLYLLRLVGHSATLLERPAAALFFLGLAGLLAVAAMALVRGRRPLPLALWTCLAGGILVTVVAAAAVRGFDPLKPSYSLWTLPVIALLAGVAVSFRPREGGAAALVFAAGALWSTALFTAHRAWFVHGPERPVADAVGADPRGVAVVYRGSDWGYAYFPLQWRYRGHLDQWTVDFGGRLHHLMNGGAIDPAATDPAALGGYRRVVIAEINLRSYAGLRSLLGTGTPPPPAGEPAPSGFRQTGAETVPGLYSLALFRFDRETR